MPWPSDQAFETLAIGERVRLAHTLTGQDFAALSDVASSISANIADPAIALSSPFRAAAAQNNWAGALIGALIAGRLPGGGATAFRQTVETMLTASPGDEMIIEAMVAAKSAQGATIDVRATNRRGELAMKGIAEIAAPARALPAEPSEPQRDERAEKGLRFRRFIDHAKGLKPLCTAVVHPVDKASLTGAVEAAREGLIEPILVGPEAKIRRAAEASALDISPYRIVGAEHSHAAADRAVAMARSGEVEALMKGALHTDEFMHAVVAAATGLRTARRISHAFVIDAPAYPRALFITDAAVNIYPDLLDKRDIVQNAIELAVALGVARPRVAILSAVETVSPDIRSTIDAAALCKMADRGQIIGGVLDGPLAFDNAVSADAARIKGIVSPVAGQADIFVAPDLEAGNMLAKQLVYLAEAEMAGVVLGARVPLILTSRSDNTVARLGSCAVALTLARRHAPQAA
jgi:phosphate acetyltransferase/phosphate butyryltransferase